MNPLGVIKDHPYLAGGAVIVTVIVVFAFTGKSSTSGPSVTASGAVQSDPNTAALLTAQVNAGVRNNELTASLDAANIQADVARHTADLQYGVTLNDSNNAADVAKATLGAQTQLGLATISAQQTVALGSQETQRFQYQTQADEIITQSNNDMAVALDTNAKQAQVTLAGIAEKQVADTLAANTANHAIDVGAQMQTQAIAAAEGMQQLDLASTWIREQFAYSQEQQIAQTMAPYQLAAIQAQVGGQVAVAQANNNHGGVALGPFSYRY